MGFFISPRGPCELKSVSLRTNEEFIRLYNDVVEARRFNLPDDVRDFQLSRLDSRYRSFLVDREWQDIQKSIWYVDYLMKRVEKYAQFSEVLPVFMLYLEQQVFRNLRRFCSYYGDGTRCFLIGLGYFESLMRKVLLEDFLKVFADFVTSGLESANELGVSALTLLSSVYQYLIGCVDKVGGKTYSPGSFLFRLVFVAIVLFLGSYVWIKFRQASFTANRRKRKLGGESDVQAGGVYRRAVKDSRGEVTHYKYEPRFKPLREKSESGTPLNFNCLSLGSYNTRREAEIVRHIAVVLYGEEEGRSVQFEDGLRLPFPSVTERENCPPCGKEKAVWVTQKTKDLYAELLREKARRLQLLHPAVETTGSHHGHGGEASGSDPSPSAPGASSAAFELTCFTSPHGGNGVVEQATTSESHGLGQAAPLAQGVYSAFVSDFDFDQFISSILQQEENENASPATDQIEGDYPATDCVFGLDSTSVPPRSSALDNPTSAVFASRPQLRRGDQGLESIVPHLNSITFQQLESLPEQVPVHQHVTCQETRPEEFPGSNVELQQKLLESEVRISELEQKLRQSEVENEKWRSMFHQVAKLMSASNLDGHPVDIQ